MSYDLTIRSDETYSQSTPKSPLDQYIAKLPGIVPNGESGFAIDDPPARLMEIDLEVVSEEGDSIGESWRIYDAINCIRMHIPYAFLSNAIERDYLPTGFAIADFVGWPLYDEQTGEIVPRDGTRPKP